MFLSKVPILKDLYIAESQVSQIPGPGAYFDELDQDPANKVKQKVFKEEPREI